MEKKIISEAPPLEAQPLPEQDTTDIEDIQDILAYVLPTPTVIETASSLGIQYNKAAFRGWVRQPSPCCAAASVAGAWNALHDFHRQNILAIGHRDVLQIYCEIMDEKLAKKQASFERKLGGKLDEYFWNCFQNGSLQRGKFFGGKKGFNINTKVMESVIRQMVREHSNDTLAEKEDSDLASFNSRNVFNCFRELYELEGIDLGKDSSIPDLDGNNESLPQTILTPEESAYDSKKSTGDVSEGEEESVEDEDDNKEELKSSTKVWQWRKDFMEVYKQYSGLVKLRNEKPSTAPIGNWGIISAIEQLSERAELGTQISARLFMGKKKSKLSKVDYPLLRKDSEESITTQWNALRNAMSQNNQILLFHLKNHYALIFACREWCCEDTQVRQILTARKGQRPVAWIDFSEARETMLGWEGYKIIAITSKLSQRELIEFSKKRASSVQCDAKEQENCYF